MGGLTKLNEDKPSPIMKLHMCQILIALAAIIPIALSNYINHSLKYDYVHIDYGVPVANCGGEFTDVNAVLYPSDQLYIGEEAYLYMNYKSPIEIDGGYVITDFSFNGVPYAEFNTSLCSNSGSLYNLRSSFSFSNFRLYEKQVSSDCPIQPGFHNKNSSFTVPNVEGLLKSKISWHSSTGTLLLCLKLLVHIVPNEEDHHHPHQN